MGGLKQFFFFLVWLINSSEQKKKKPKHLFQKGLRIGMARRWLLLPKASHLVNGLGMRVVKKGVRFDALAESLFLLITSNHCKRAISESLCWNGFCPTLLGKHQMQAPLFWLGFPPLDGVPGQGPGRLGRSCDFRDTNRAFQFMWDTLRLLLLFLLRHTALSDGF